MMVQGFKPIPDWFSWENQGAGIAITDLGDGQQHLIVLMVDKGTQGNRGVYRIGRRLNAAGEVTGGWTGWIDVPDWFSAENQGADIAVADLAGNGSRDLIVLMVDNQVGQNRGIYRVGRGLDANGNITGGWTGWIDVPFWFSWENQGAGVAISSPDAQGRRNLVVFMIDNPPGLNQGLYKIGRTLNADGAVTDGWTGWVKVPGWFSWENQGAGVAVADLAGGSRGLVVMQIDNAPAVGTASGQNQGFFRIGDGLDEDGMVQNWGPDWLGVPWWFSWENQYGSISVATLSGKRKLFVLMIDNPPGQNAGFYQVLDLDPDQSVHGSWQVQQFPSGVLAVHAALLPHGSALFFAGSGSSQTRFRSPDFGDVAKGVAVSTVWTPPNNTFTTPATLRTPDNRPFDLFCGGDAFLADGRLLSAGGTQAYDPFKGRADVAVFDPTAGTWSFVAPMKNARWYPSLIALGDGRVLATTGLDGNGDDGSKTNMEVYDPTSNAWRVLHFPGPPGLPLYAHLFLMADGRIFFSGGRMDDPMVTDPFIFDIRKDPVLGAPVPDLLDPVRRNQSASVLLPPAQDQRVLVAGGGPVGKQDQTHATDKASVVDLKAAQPAYVAAAPMGLPRMHLNLVLLPDRTVFASGGSLKQESAPLSRLQAELYDPATDAWQLMATAEVPRLYHSTALLLPDGRVVAAGSNPEGGHSVAWGRPPDPDEELRLEIFSPPYLFRGPRPVIDHAPDSADYGSTILIQTAQANDIKWISLVRNGVTTHSFDNGQRLLDLPIGARAPAELHATMPANGNLAPPGWYMLFLVNNAGVPSIATWLHLPVA
jgi:galactose oxidase-like protein